MQDLCDFHDYNFRKYKGDQRILKMARNLVDFEAGRTIFEVALGVYNQNKNTNQKSIFDEID
jgi:DNA (cytosine-5)-methyltransferase 1